MKRVSNIAVYAAAFVAVSCGGASTGPGETGPPELLAISGRFVITLSPGQEHRLTVRAYDGAGRAARLPEHGWSSDRPERVEVDADGAIRAREIGHAWIRVTGAGGLRDSVAVWVQKPDDQPSTFDIKLIFADDVPDFWRERLREAESRWEHVIRDRLPAVDIASLVHHCGVVESEQQLPEQSGMETGTRIFVAISDQFPIGTYVSAVGGPCRQRALPYPTTALGQITLNRDFFARPENRERLRYVAHHEMGHTLGIAGIVQGFQPPWIEPVSGSYTGHLAIEGYRRDTGRTVAVLDVGNGSHWPERGLMGAAPGLLDGIHAVSVGMLMDFGYPAAWYGAGEY